MIPKVVFAAAGLTATALVLGRRKKQLISNGNGLYAELGLGKSQNRQIVQVFSPSTAALTTTAQSADAAEDAAGSSGSSTSSTLHRSYAFSSLLLLLSLALAAYTAGVLLLRGQPDLAAAAAITWLLAAPAVLALGRQQAASAAAAAAAASATSSGGVAASETSSSADATMLITELELPTQLLSQYHGTWIKDAAASDSMDAAVRLVHLNAVMRQAVKLIRGVQLTIEEGRFRFAVFSAISWFKLGESYPWSGEVCENRRRDMRRGRSHGQVHISAKGTICLRYTWDHPYSGHATDEFSLDELGRLRLYTVVNVGDQVVSYTQVYRRKSQSH